MHAAQRKLLFLSSLGGILEFYDFIIYALFAEYIAHAFFPAANTLMSLIITFATFAIGYLVRPLGGIVFGHFGDRIGRKATFTISIFMMALATLAIGITPPFTMIGIAAPIIIVTLRIIQGLSIGGEIPGAITYVSESLADKKGLACGIIFCALLLGIALGSITQATITDLFNETQMQSFGFRIPFILGGIFGIASYVLRRELRESSQFLAIEKRIERFPMVPVIKKHWAEVIIGILTVSICAALISSLFLFIPSYFSKVLNLPPTAYLWERTAATIFGAFMTILFGYLADKINPYKLLLALNLSAFLLAYPIYNIYAHRPEFYFEGFMIAGLLIGFAAGVIPCLLGDLFPTNIRYSGIAISYNMGFAIFAGLTPVISLSLIYYTKSVVAPAGYLVAVASIAGATAVYIRSYFKKKKEMYC